VRESAHWDDFPSSFAARIPGSRIVCIELPGNGRHWQLKSPLSLNEMMEFARREFQDALVGSDEPGLPVFLFTISLGSMLAVEWAFRYPEEIAGAVMVNTSLRTLSPLYRRLNWRYWGELARILAESDIASRERRILALTTGMGHGDAESVLRRRIDVYREHPVQRANVFRQLWAAARYRPPLTAPGVPMLLLAGQADRLVDPRCTEEIGQAWKLVPRRHPAAGHDLPLDDPDWTIAAVCEWLVERMAGRS
jgi:pimeloyl-ACP methyl ester carboxylesterase